MPQDVRLETHVLDVERGVWCEHCLLPSAIKATAAIVSSHTLHVLARVAGCYCPECGAFERLPAEGST